MFLNSKKKKTTIKSTYYLNNFFKNTALAYL